MVNMFTSQQESNLEYKIQYMVTDISKYVALHCWITKGQEKINKSAYWRLDTDMGCFHHKHLLLGQFDVADGFKINY